MIVIDVIPIAKGIGIEILSYFTSLSVVPGAIVKVPLRSKMVPALVVHVHTAQELKTELKTADYSLKKIDSALYDSFVSPQWLSLIDTVAYYYATTTGSVLHALIPQTVLLGAGKKSEALRKSFGVKTHEQQNNHENLGHKKQKIAFQGSDDDRYSAYKSLIRQEFAQKKSIFIVVPTHEDGRRIFDEIVKGLEGYVFLLTGAQSDKEIMSLWGTAINLLHPIVIIGTGQFLSIPRNDISTIIIERENSRHYTLQHRPYIDIRTYAEMYAKIFTCTIIYGDTVLRIETLYRVHEGEISEGNPFSLRSFSSAEDTVIDMRDEQSSGKKSFKVLSDTALKYIRETKERSERMIILATRRGLAPSVVCGDCHNIVMCTSCSTPIVLHSSPKGSFFMCHRCGERRSADESCSICGGWKLGTVGIGIDLVVEKIHEEIKGIKVFKIDSDTTKTDTAIKTTLTKFYDTPGSILIGTEMMLPYIRHSVEHAIIASIDSLLSLPDFRIYEKILSTLTRIRSYATRSFIIQTRTPKDSIFDFARKGNIIDFYRSHIEERKRFNYPPISTLIKITIEGDRTKISEEMHGIQNLLSPYTVDVFPAFTHTIKGKYVLHGLMTIPRARWPHDDIISRLKNLPPHITVKIDPESLL